MRAIAPLDEFGKSVKSLIEHTLSARPEDPAGRVLMVTYRVKGEQSAERKVARPPRQGSVGAGPRSLGDLHDLLGIRIVMFFGDGVDIAAQMIEREFTIDQENSVDKRAVLDADRFGYLSRHYVAELDPTRARLPEYKAYRGIKFEVQIRSFLQHAWAEIEHDLGYKSTEAVPNRLRRRFALLAALLELADDQFVGTREEIVAHQASARESIQQGSLVIEINQDSLSEFVRSSPQTQRLDAMIGEYQDATVENHVDLQYLGRTAGDLKALGFSAVQDVSSYLDDNREQLPKFTRQWLRLTNESLARSRIPVRVPIGITLYYLGALKYSQALGDENELVTEYAQNKGLLQRALDAALAENSASSDRKQR